MQESDEAQGALWTLGRLRQYLCKAATEAGTRPEAQAQCLRDVQGSASLCLSFSCKEAGCCVLSQAAGRAEQGAVLGSRGSHGF